jgi:glycosyltransferase involved in cell wall biosynthesis
MRVVVVEPRSVGGMVHYAYRLCSAMAAAGADVVLVTSVDYELAAEPHAFAVHPILRTSSRRTGPAPAASGRLQAVARRARRLGRLAARGSQTVVEWVRLFRHLRGLRPDVVQFGSIEHAIEGPFLWALRGRGALLAAVVHEPEIRTDRRLRWAVDVALYRAIYRAFDAVFLHGEANRRRFAELYPNVPIERTHLIRMGSLVALPEDRDADVDLRARYGLPADAPTAVFFGTLQPNKGLEDLVQAFALVRERRPDARLIIAGHPSRHMRQGALQEEVRALGLDGTVVVDPRYVPNEEVGPLMRLARFAVLPYRSATQSGALQVAYACGRPVVATSVGALPEAVEDGASGVLVPPRAPAALADAMVALFDDPEGTGRMGDHARHLSQTRYSWEAIAATILDTYRRALARAT